jgi:hypothetical protein
VDANVDCVEMLNLKECKAGAKLMKDCVSRTNTSNAESNVNRHWQENIVVEIIPTYIRFLQHFT